MPLRKVVGSPLSITQFRIAPARSQGSSSSRRRSSVGDGQIIGSLSSDLKVTVAGRLVTMGEASTMPRGRVAVKIGRAACRERVCPYVEVWVGAVSLKKKK